MENNLIIFRKQKLVKVFRDTLEFCKDEKLNKAKTEKISNWEKKIYFPKTEPIVKVINKDCVEVAYDLSLKGKTCVLNMANAFNRGGGVERGSMAQEEELCRRSNLWYSLRPSFYPLGETEFIYSKNIKFLKDKYYDLFLNDNTIDYSIFKCDVITIAAINLRNSKIKKSAYESITKNKIQQMLLYPAQRGCKNLVLSAFGCGAFMNNPIFMSKTFKSLMKELPYENITFAILDDANSKANGISNFETFKKTFEV